ncbi:hypothetical protein [Trinickia mobilis]|uniref:hypothetical protein n=1 Tax=Trinickia mobilis TaxID=2816356 RepID=UPI001A906C9D|nr:hypothetical protein [Trinickia mobilis]
MGMKLALGVSMALVSLTGVLHSAPALADGPKAAYDNGGVADASLDPGEERMTADEENNARLKDLSDAYHNGYNARAKEDAETYASLRDQLKRPPQQQASSQLMPPLPEGAPPGQENAQIRPVQKPQVAQRALQPQPQQPQYQQAYQQPQYAPPAPPPQAPRYQAAPQYAAAPAYQEVAQAYQEPAYEEEAYEPPPPPPPQTYQYVPVYTQTAYVPQPPVQALVQPVVTIARPVAYPVYRSAYWAPRYRRAYAVRYGYPVQMAGYAGWE